LATCRARSWLTVAALAAVSPGCGSGETSMSTPPDAAIDAVDAPACQGLACAQVQCGGGATTSISGTVTMPNGVLPLPGVTVYVPRGAVAPISTGASCDRCSAGASERLVEATSDAAGHFTLTNMPATTQVPLVLQIGKWRRQVVLPAVARCVDTAVEAGLSRLPRTRSEGDIPRIAVSTGERDALECLLRKVGLDDSEFGVAGSAARVHLFAGFGGGAMFDAANGGSAFTASTSLWASEASLSAYDAVVMSCEGEARPETKPAAALTAMKAYADKGGRILAGHWHNYWLAAGPAPWSAALTINSRNSLGDVAVDVDPSFAGGARLSAWLLNVGASSVAGKLPVAGAYHTMVDASAAYVERWLRLDTNANGVPSVQLAAMTMPLEAAPAQRCGRVVVSDVHASTVDRSAAFLAVPSGGCTTDKTTLTPQEKLMAYLVFAVDACMP
jgi:hypothetical protein